MDKHLRVKAYMLAEGIRPSPLQQQIGLSAPLLPLRSDSRLLDEWFRVLSTGGLIGESMEVVVASRAGFRSMDPIADDGRYDRTIDPRSHRGTAGVIADLQRGQFKDSVYDYLLLIEGGSCPPSSIKGLAEAMRAGEDVILGASDIDRFAGIAAVKPETLAVVPDRGYQDFKEQSIPRMLAAGSSLAAVPIIHRAIRVRTLETWLEAIRSVATAADSTGRNPGGRIEGTCCISGTARIDGGLIRDSVIMDGAVIESGAIVARSAVLPGQRVGKDSRVIDSIVGVTSKHGHEVSAWRI